MQGKWVVYTPNPLKNLKDFSKMFFILKNYIKMEDNWFTMLCWFLPYINMNQPKVCTCSLPLDPPSHFPLHPTQVVTDHQTEIPALYSNFPLAIGFTHGIVYISMALSQFVPPFPFLLCVHKSVLYPCPENRFINTFFLNSIYMH